MDNTERRHKKNFANLSVLDNKIIGQIYSTERVSNECSIIDRRLVQYHRLLRYLYIFFFIFLPYLKRYDDFMIHKSTEPVEKKSYFTITPV